MGKDSVQKLNLRLSFEVRLTEVIFCLDKALQPVFTYLVFGIYSFSVRNIITICDTLRDLVPFLRFKTREKHPWRSVTLKPTTLLKVTLLVFHVF